MSATTHQEPASPTAGGARAWSLARRISFRFVGVYLVLFFFPSPIDALPFVGERLTEGVNPGVWQPFVRFVGRHVLHLGGDLTWSITGSGDTTFGYVRVFGLLLVSALVTMVWSVADRRREHHERLEAALRVYVRYMLAASVLGYGLAKVLPLQFSFPGPLRLVGTYGESSPMALLWTFMGYSRGYTFFAGAAEVLGAVLLFSRRTTLLGALVVMGVMANVVTMNFCYDVPVKIFSTHLFLMAALLASPDARRLIAFFVLNRRTEPAPLRAPFAARRMERAWIVGKVIAIATIVLGQAWESWSLAKEVGAPRSPFYGMYDVESYVRDGAEVPPLLTDTSRPRRLFVAPRGFMLFIKMDGRRQRFDLKEDREKKTFTLQAKPDEPATTMSYRTPDAEHLELDGTLEGAALRIRLTKIDESKFLLVNRGFHWINEVPLNR